MDVPGTMGGMHKDDLEKEIVALLDGHEFRDGLGNLQIARAHREPGCEPVITLDQVSGKHTGRREWTQFRIGR